MVEPLTASTSARSSTAWMRNFIEALAPDREGLLTVDR